MDRTIIDPLEQMRDFDFVMGAKDVLLALAGLCADLYSTLPYSVVGGLTASQTTIPTLSFNLTAGRVYQFAQADAAAVGSIPLDATTIVQQGYAAPQTITLTAPSSGQSQWTLIQAQFSQVDAVRASDPNGGIVPFYNASNPSQPTSNSINTVRKGLCVLQAISGSPATTGSETPPTATNGWVGLYLIDLAGGQTQIGTSQILVAGPSVGTGVPSGYPYAPFIAGLLASHHSGTAGQAPKIKLGSEVQGVLPYANMSLVRQFLTGNITLYVNGSTGLDTNSGLSPTTAFKTLTAATSVIYHAYDFAGFGATVSVANGTYTAGMNCIGVPPGMPGSINIVGNVGNPGACFVTVANASAFIASSGANLNVSGFTLAASGTAGQYTTPGVGLLAAGASTITFSTLVFGNCSTAHMQAFSGGNIISGGAAYAISVGSPSHAAAANGGVIVTVNSTVTLTNTPTFSAGFANAQAGGSVLVFTMAFVGAAAGPRYFVSNGGFINTNGGGTTYLPGNSAGTGTNFGATPWGLYV